MGPKKISTKSPGSNGLQMYPCAKRTLRGAKIVPTKCFVCAKRGSNMRGDVCRFVEFRTIGDSGDVDFTRRDEGLVQGNVYPDRFDASVTSGLIKQLQYSLAALLKPVLQAMEMHETLPGLVRKAPEMSHRLLCDSCSTSLFSSSFFCQLCGYEICPLCASHARMDHWPLCELDAEHHPFRPLSRLADGEVQAMIVSVDSALRGGQPAEAKVPIQAKAKKADADVGRKVPLLSWGQSDVFNFLWAHNIPVVVENLDSRLKARWTPDTFTYSHGQDVVSMIRCAPNATGAKIESATVEQFFAEFKIRPHKDVVKIKDWPPSADLSTKFLDYFNDFMDAVPMPSYTRHNGFLNLAAHYPSPSKPGEHKSFKPDLGPKMYIATRDLHSQGSTPLHLDATSAVNILVHVEPDGSGEDGALWHIFSADDTPNLRKYLRQTGNTSPDPIHAQSTYLTDPMLADLWNQYRIKPYRIIQRYGDAVFIPAGSPHQVSNRSGCIKIACDFLCVEGVAASRVVSTEFQALRCEDILQLDAMLWHSWCSLARLSTVVADDSNEDDDAQRPTRLQRKRMAGRATSNARDDRIRKKRQRKSESNRDLHDAGVFRYPCPHPACEGSKRLPFDLNGVLCHLRNQHELDVDRSWQQLGHLSPAEFAAEFARRTGALGR